MSRAPGRQGLQSRTSEQSSATAGGSWRVVPACLHTLLGLWSWSLLGAGRERGTEKTLGGLYLVFLGFLPSSVPSRETEKHRASDDTLSMAERTGERLARTLLLSLPSRLHLPRLDMMALMASRQGAGRGLLLHPSLPSVRDGCVGIKEGKSE